MSVYGTARYAEEKDLRAAGLIKDRPPGSYPQGLMIGWWINDQYDFQPIEYTGDLHQLIVAGTGGGKFTTGLAPLIMGSVMNNTVVVVDPKGEIANLTGPYWEVPFGSEPTVNLFDPWDECRTGRCATLNVLDQLTPSNPNYVDDARALADAMVIPSGGENTHWDNAARNFLTAVLLYVALSPQEKDRRDLVRVRELVTMPWAMPKTYTGPKHETLSEHLYVRWLDSDLADGAVKRGASGILNREDKERSGIISSIERDTAWIDSPQMKRVLRGTGIDLTKVGRGGDKYYIVLPPAFFMTHRAWLRMMVTTFANVLKRNPSTGQPGSYHRFRHIIIDEFANLGEMNFVLNDIAVARGFDVKYHLAIQDLSQLARVYAQGWESFINNTFQRFFAVSDMFTAEYVSRMLGGTTVQSTGYSTGTTSGESFGDGGGTNRGQSFTSGGMGQPHDDLRKQHIPIVQRKLRQLKQPFA
jgi:type IV secretion system protein VirD4